MQLSEQRLLAVVTAGCLGSVHCFNAWPALGCIPLQVVAVGVLLPVVIGSQKMGMREWHLCIIPLGLAAIFGMVHQQLFALVMLLTACVVAAGAAVATLSFQKRPIDRALGFSLFVGYALGRWCPMIF